MQNANVKIKRITKTVIGVLTTGLLVTHFAEPASAQVASKTIPVSINTSGVVPASVTNATVTLSCKNTTSTSNYQGEKATSITLGANQINLNNFALESVPAGALCKFGVSGIGPTQAAGSTPIGTVTLILGGAPATDPTRYITGPTPGVTSDFLTLADNTTAVINLQFPAVNTGATTTTVVGSSTIPGQTTIPGQATIPGQTTTTIRGGIIFLPIETATSTIPSTTSTTGLATTTTSALSSSTSTVPPTTVPVTTVATLPVVTTSAPVTKAPVVEPEPTDTKPARAKRSTTNKRKATLAAKKATKKKASKVRSTKTTQR